MTKLVLLSVAITLSVLTARANAAAPKPNIVIILSDDMGFSDLGCYGSEIHTPNLDKLAAGGLRFTQFYNTARCCPTRASLLTGLYPHQADVGHMVDQGGKNLPGYRGDLAANVVTIAEALKPAGYGTYAIGKWHVTPPPNAKNPADQHNWPRQRGFDRYYGTIVGAGNYFDPKALVRDDTLITAATDTEYKPQQFYYTDAISHHAVQFIREHDKARKNDPLLMYVAFTAAHWPLHAPEEEIAKYTGKYDAGYDAIRDARVARLRQMGLIDPNWKPVPTAKNWADVKDKAWEARCMEVYAAQIDRMDQGIGQIVAALEQTGRLNDTLIFFLQDNGGCAESLGRNPGPDGKSPAMPGPTSTFISYGEGWANVSNTPFREYKHWVHEGGISTPLIAHWPAGIGRNGELEKQPGHLIDIMATCLDLSGATMPKECNSKPTLPPEGRSLRAAFEGKKIDRAEPIFFEHEGNRAVRESDWKLVAKGPKGAWELYDMKADRTELNDLSAAQPDRVKEMTARWQTWAARTNTIPWPWGKNDENANTGPTGPLTFKPGQNLLGDESPAVSGKALHITATIARPGRNGVIIAQGGTAEGFSLYLKDGHAIFATRHNNKLTQIEAKDPLPAATKELAVTLNHEGAVTIMADGKTIAEAKTPGPMLRRPTEGLSVGSDVGAAVGSYEAPFPFDGTLQSVNLELKSKATGNVERKKECTPRPDVLQFIDSD